MLFRQKPRDKAAPVFPDEIGGVRLRASARARRMALRVETRTGDVVLTWPQSRAMGPKGMAAALAFIEQNRGWIAKHQARKPAPLAVADGAVVTVLGREYRIVHAAGRGLARFDGETIVLHGQAEHLARRLRDFLKKEAAQMLQARAAQKAAALNLRPSPVRVIDPKSRWGSCAPDGSLMFSWRLILCPEAVMDYVVAHEVAHRIHMNHSRRFWALCLSLCDNGAASRRWLKVNGAQVMAV